MDRADHIGSIPLGSAYPKDDVEEKGETDCRATGDER